MKYWLYLAAASCMEVFWMYSLKFINFKEIKGFFVNASYFALPEYKVLLPPLGYIVFGVFNVALFSMSMKGISAPVAFACWMGLTLILSLIAEAFLTKLTPDYKQIFFMSLILIGAVGLKMTTKS